MILQKKLNYLIKNKEKKNKHKDQQELLEMITVFLKQGYSINDTIIVLKFRYDLSSWIVMLEEGMRLSEVLAAKKFDKDVLLIIEVSENSGNLKTGIIKANELLSEKIKRKNEFLELIKYPLLLSAISFFSLLFISTFLLPQFENIYQSFGIEGDLLLKFLYLTMRTLPYIILFFFIIGLSFFMWYLSKDSEQKLKIILKNKYLKKYYFMIYNQIFVINITNLLKMDLKMDEVLNILESQEYNLFLQAEIKKINQLLNQGYSFYETLNPDYYEGQLIQLIKDGEENSLLRHNLESYNIFLQNIQKNKNEKLLYLIQPIFYGFLSLLIIILYSSIFIPMFEMMDAI